MKVKEILNMNADDLEKMMTQEEFDRMQALGLKYTWQLRLFRRYAKLI